MTINRVRVLWSGFSGAPGYSNFYFDTAAAPPLAALQTMFTAFKPFFTAGPPPLTWQVQNSGDTLDETTGKITGAWTGALQPAIVATGASANYVGSAGAVITWRSSTPVGGRRPVGKTYLVPLMTNQFDTDGSIIPATLTAILNAALTFVTAAAGSLLIWHRPVYNTVPSPPVLVRPGSTVVCIGALVPDLAAVMRSRRR